MTKAFDAKVALKWPALSFYQGELSHVRRQPKPHRLRYQYSQFCLDVSATEVLSKMGWAWSDHRVAPIRFRRQDYLPGALPLKDTVAALIKEKFDDPEPQRILLLANLSYWGKCFNPVCFFLCMNRQSELTHLVAEVHNTPWGERHVYAVRASGSSSHQAEFDKDFHVSPFMPMNLRYQWRFTVTRQRIKIYMGLRRDGQTLFSSILKLSRAPMTQRALPLTLFLHNRKILWQIYWQALVMWVKRFRFYSHPKSPAT